MPYAQTMRCFFIMNHDEGLNDNIVVVASGGKGWIQAS